MIGVAAPLLLLLLFWLLSVLSGKSILGVRMWYYDRLVVGRKEVRRGVWLTVRGSGSALESLGWERLCWVVGE